MLNYLKLLLQRFSARELDDKSEVDRIALLQQAAAARRKEYAAEKEKAESTGDALLAAALSTRRQRMQEAELAHIAALQKWENRQARQRSY